MKYFNLTNAQKSISDSILNPANGAFNLNFKRSYPSEDLKFLKEAVNTVCSSYLDLRIIEDNGNYKQYHTDNTKEDCFEYYNLSRKSDYKIEEFIDNFLKGAIKEIIDVPLYKIALLKCDDYVLLVGSFSHIIVDGTSLFTIFPREIDRCIALSKKSDKYDGCEYSYRDYVEEENKYTLSKEYLEDKEFWINHLRNYSQDWYGLDRQELAICELVLDDALRTKLERLNVVDNTHISPFVLAFSVVSLYFAKSKSFEDIVWNTTVSGRYFKEGMNDMIGMLANIIPLRCHIDKNMSFSELLLTNKKLLKEGLSHAKIQPNEYSRELTENDVNPEMLSMYSIVSNSNNYSSMYKKFQKDTEFPLHVRVNRNCCDSDGLQSLYFEYNRNLFSPNQIKNMVDAIRNLLLIVSDNPGKACGEYDVEVNEFFEAENFFRKYYEETKDKAEIDITEYSISGYLSLEKANVTNLSKESSMSIEELVYAVIVYALSRKVNDRLLISMSFLREHEGYEYMDTYNEIILKYSYNSNMTFGEYLEDFKKEYRKIRKYYFYPLKNNRKLSVESDILLNCFNSTSGIDRLHEKLNKDIPLEDYKLVFSLVNSDDELKLYVKSYSEKLTKNILEDIRSVIKRR